MDYPWDRVAEVLVNYSVGVKPGDKVLITMMETDTWPLARACYREAVRAGGLPFIEFQSVQLESDIMRLGNMEQVSWVCDMHYKGMEWADCYIGLRGASNPYEFNGISPEIVSAHKKAMGIISAKRNDTRWVLTRVPNAAYAQQAGKSTDEIMKFYFDATTCDYNEFAEKLEVVRKRFNEGDLVRIVGKDTDISFRTAGRKYATGIGYRNMPDGEVFTSPLEDTVNGHVYFDYPAMYGGKAIHGIRLAFENGKLISATSDDNQTLLFQVLHMDEGACKLGEFGIGMNYGITDFSGDILFDEKIGGTIHLAMGRAYERCDGTNYSALHWDIVKNMRQDSAVYVDGVKLMENGQFIEGV